MFKRLHVDLLEPIKRKKRHQDNLGHHRIQSDTMDLITFGKGITPGTRCDTMDVTA